RRPFSSSILILPASRPTAAPERLGRLCKAARQRKSKHSGLRATMPINWSKRPAIARPHDVCFDVALELIVERRNDPIGIISRLAKLRRHRLAGYPDLNGALINRVTAAPYIGRRVRCVLIRPNTL